MKIALCLGVHHNIGNCMKGSQLRKVENHYLLYRIGSQFDTWSFLSVQLNLELRLPVKFLT